MQLPCLFHDFPIQRRITTYSNTHIVIWKKQKCCIMFYHLNCLSYQLLQLCCYIDLCAEHTMLRQIIVHNLRAQIPCDNGDMSIAFSNRLIMHNVRTTSMLTRPGFEGGIRKLSQLIQTIIVVGI